MELVQDIRVSRRPAAAFLVLGLYWGSFAALAPQLKAQTGLSDEGFGMALLMGACGAVMAMWLAPRAAARLRHRALGACALLLAAAYLLPGLAGGGVAFGLSMTAVSAASGVLDVVMNARVSQLEAERRRSLMNLNHAIYSFAYAGSAVTAGLLREAGFAPFSVFALCGGVTAVLVLTMREGHPARVPPAQGGPAPELPVLMLTVAGVIVLLGFVAEQATEAWSALHLERTLGTGPAEGALGPAILGFTMGIGRLSGQLVAQRLSEGAVMRIAAAVAAAGTLLAAWAGTPAMAYAGFAVLGFGVSVVAPMAFAWMGKHVPDALRMTAIARLSVIGYTGFFIGPPLMGFLAGAYGLPVAFSAVAAGLMAVPLVLVPALRRLAGR